MLYRRPGADGGLAGGARRQERGHAIDRSILDAGVRDSATARTGSVPGECAAHQESPGAQERHCGMPVAAEVAHLRVVEQQFSAERCGASHADAMAASRGPGGAGRQRDSADAKSVDRDEYTAQQRAERSERGQRHGHPAGDPGGGARPAETGGLGGSAGEGQPDGDCQELTRKLAAGVVVCAGPGDGDLSGVPRPDRRLRWEAATASARNGIEGRPGGATDRPAAQGQTSAGECS